MEKFKNYYEMLTMAINDIYSLKYVYENIILNDIDGLTVEQLTILNNLYISLIPVEKMYKCN